MSYGQVDPFLCIVCGIAVLLCIFLSWYFVRLYKHPIEKEGAVWPQIVVIASLSITLCSMFLPALDVANGNGGIPMDMLWFVVFMTQGCMIFAVLPFAIFYYQSYDVVGDLDEDGQLEPVSTCQCKAWRDAVCYTGVSITVISFLIGMLWSYCKEATIEVETFTGALVALEPLDITTMGCRITSWDAARYPAGPPECVADNQNLIMDVTVTVYTIAFIAFLGWFIFSVFAGVGLAALPLTMINAYLNRVRFLTQVDRAGFKAELGLEAKEVHAKLRKYRDVLKDAEYVEDCQEPDSTDKRLTKQAIRELLERKESIMSRYENFKVCDEAAQEREAHICWHCMELFGGIFALILSIFWVTHIGLFMFWEDPVYGFLNLFLVELDDTWGFFGVTLYATFSFYLMLCVLKGDTIFGGVLTSHSLKYKETLMSAFLVNCLLLAISTAAALQFCMQAFKGYAGPNTAATLIFNVAARNLKGFTYLYTNNIFVWILLSMTALYLLYFLMCRKTGGDLTAQMLLMNEQDASSGRGKSSARKNLEHDNQVHVEMKNMER